MLPSLRGSMDMTFTWVAERLRELYPGNQNYDEVIPPSEVAKSKQAVLMYLTHLVNWSSSDRGHTLLDLNLGDETEGHSWGMSNGCTDLLSMMWLQLHRDILDKVHTRQCRNCNRAFRPTRKNHWICGEDCRGRTNQMNFYHNSKKSKKWRSR